LVEAEAEMAITSPIMARGGLKASRFVPELDAILSA